VCHKFSMFHVSGEEDSSGRCSPFKTSPQKQPTNPGDTPETGVPPSDDQTAPTSNVPGGWNAGRGPLESGRPMHRAVTAGSSPERGRANSQGIILPTAVVSGTQTTTMMWALPWIMLFNWSFIFLNILPRWSHWESIFQTSPVSISLSGLQVLIVKSYLKCKFWCLWAELGLEDLSLVPGSKFRRETVWMVSRDLWEPSSPPLSTQVGTTVDRCDSPIPLLWHDWVNASLLCKHTCLKLCCYLSETRPCLSPVDYSPSWQRQSWEDNKAAIIRL
jgi:hypothetical protein